MFQLPKIGFLSFSLLLTLAPALVLAMPGGSRSKGTEPGSKSTVALFSEDAEATFCTGALINKRVVLTAAHCLGEITIRGASVLFTNARGEIVKVKVAATMMHEGYEQKVKKDFLGINSTPYTQNDVGLVLLDEPAPAWSQVAVIETAKLKASVEAITFGFGIHSVGDSFMKDDIKRFGTFKISSNFEDQMTAAGKARDLRLCYGDSGGPTYGLSLKNGAPVVKAVSSALQVSISIFAPSLESCKKGQKASLISVPHHAKWILENTSLLVKQGADPELRTKNIYAECMGAIDSEVLKKMDEVFDPQDVGAWDIDTLQIGQDSANVNFVTDHNYKPVTVSVKMDTSCKYNITFPR